MPHTNHRSHDFLLDIPRGAVHIWAANSSSEIREQGIGGPIMRPFRHSRPHVEDLLMRILQPADWSKPRGFSHGVAVDGPGRWIVLAGQTGGEQSGEYQPDLAGQVAVALRRIVKLLTEAGAGPEHIVRLTWYLTSRSEYEAAGSGIGAAWRETLGRNFPPSTLLYIDGLVDARAKVEIEVTAFVPTA
ncbi:MAG TPA: RidA family protein [Bryobacteraceae bacterium]|nr:RidA family protein [Bryobacteraceae bacterium]